MKHQLLKLSLIAMVAGCSSGYSEEILLFRGPKVSTPALEDGPESKKESLVFEKEFYLDAGLVGKLPASLQPSEEVAVSAQKAIELATQSIYQGEDRPRVLNVVRLELLSAEVPQSKKIDFYLIETVVNGSTEHRLVLMDGTVVKSQLKRISAKPDAATGNHPRPDARNDDY
jgi:hypothetical protein